MGIEALDAGEGFDRGQGFFERFLIHAHNAGAALKLIGTQTGEGFTRAACGQGVAWAGEEVADGNGS